MTARDVDRAAPTDNMTERLEFRPAAAGGGGGGTTVVGGSLGGGGGGLRPFQRNQINEAVLEYLALNYPKLGEAFRSEAGLATTPGVLRGDGKLVQKWLATTRLTLKLSDVEKQLKEANEKLQLHEAVSKLKDDVDGVPEAPALRTLLGHRKSITAAAFHPVFVLLVTSSEDSTIKVWDYDAEDTALEKTLSDHTDAVNHICFDTTGKWLASASSDTSVKLWDFARMEVSRTLYGHDDAVSSVAFLSGRAARLVSGSRDKTIKVWDITNGDCLKTLTQHSEWVKGVTACPQLPSLFASCSSDFLICVWRHGAESNTSIGGSRLRLGSGMDSLSALSRGGMGGGGGDDGQSSVPQQTLEGHQHVVENVLFATDAVLQCLVSRRRAPKARAELLRETYDPDEMMDNNRLTQNGVRESESGSASEILKKTSPVLFSASRDRTVKMWDALGGNCLLTFEGHNNWVKHLQLHPNGKYLLSCSDDRSIRVWDVADGSSVSTISSAHQGFVTCIAFHPKRCLVASGSMDAKINLWHSHTSRQQTTAETSRNAVTPAVTAPTTTRPPTRTSVGGAAARALARTSVTASSTSEAVAVGEEFQPLPVAAGRVSFKQTSTPSTPTAAPPVGSASSSPSPDAPQSPTEDSCSAPAAAAAATTTAVTAGSRQAVASSGSAASSPATPPSEHLGTAPASGGPPHATGNSGSSSGSAATSPGIAARKTGHRGMAATRRTVHGVADRGAAGSMVHTSSTSPPPHKSMSGGRTLQHPAGLTTSFRSPKASPSQPDRQPMKRRSTTAVAEPPSTAGGPSVAPSSSIRTASPKLRPVDTS